MLKLLKQVLEAHGGLDRWNQFTVISPTIQFGGIAFQSKFNRAGMLTRKLDIFTKKPFVSFYDFPKKGFTGTFTPNEVYIESAGKIIASRESPRRMFASFRHKFWWDDLDLLYFAGYASWNYFNSPFLLSYPGVICEEIAPWIHKEKRLKRLRAKFPNSIPTHCQYQTFYFDDDFRMVRFDYCPEIYAKWAKAAHFCSHHRKWNSILIPTTRVVLPNGKDGIAASFPKLVWIKCSSVILT